MRVTCYNFEFFWNFVEFRRETNADSGRVVTHMFLFLAVTVSAVALVARRTNNRKVVGSRPTKVVCITVLTGNRTGVNCPTWPAATHFEL